MSGAPSVMAAEARQQRRRALDFPTCNEVRAVGDGQPAAVPARCASLGKRERQVRLRLCPVI